MSQFSILIVDDNYEKVELVGRVANNSLDCRVECVSTIKDALLKLREDFFDLLIVDMNVPNLIGEPPKIDAGCDFICTLFSNDRLNKPYSILGVTSHIDAYDKNKVKLEEFGIPLILISESDTLINIIKRKIAYYHSLKEKNTSDRYSSKISDEKVTMKWLINHVEVKHWIAAVSIIFIVFVSGIKASEFDFVKQIFKLNTTNLENTKIKP
ncbi:hypothetical protein CBX96_07435 [Shewanella sp. BC20]|uniref:response regulator n=1 Tax=Shewanella sp. BC20 TaxID=2004459 RepID=UPI000D65A6C1|nr:response regulator [Shewanella sp. BC20]PWF64017.1 hypothetical protein CBX96_07435 [Shewanella sp. BC20]